MAQIKEQIKTLEKELNKMEISNLSDAEAKTQVIRRPKELSEDLSSMKRSSQNQRTHLKYPAWVIGEAMPLDPTGHLLYKATIPRQGVIAVLPHT